MLNYDSIQIIKDCGFVHAEAERPITERYKCNARAGSIKQVKNHIAWHPNILKSNLLKKVTLSEPALRKVLKGLLEWSH